MNVRLLQPNEPAPGCWGNAAMFLVARVTTRDNIPGTFFFFFCPSHLLSSSFYSLSLLVVTQIRGHIQAGSD